MKEERKKNLKNQAFESIMERLIGKGLERSKGANSIAQWRRSQLSQLYRPLIPTYRLDAYNNSVTFI